MTEEEKTNIKLKLKEALSKEKEVSKIIIFGSFLKIKNPNDIDIAIFQDSKEVYFKLSLKYRKLTRQIANIIPLDIIPLKNNSKGMFMSEINLGETIYER
ncbi:MAG: nucleotidyltransferase domain-containing protein [Prolixibacteraceae bacterium]|jgi:predicted nucleotidyltransferase|nr:nucleotidyltransferase domain-containing protein [Prolixibacteraceae bacterium]MBT6005158.1 nucleotidyltransferase domain-containing protein [Prolixibacteraceae bacterium]MBT6766476.1 nucleotidyltransferase domain-containing protein [Prolixibacteraceae bacterium]MBT6997732.1 nucleotidyltransferase domain-containing protein [Prolixibacteraceae bacterium]MBT7396496.1 nucleotidyltransferase domain-containing protein [Prolixibacteraceae bacterium]